MAAVNDATLLSGFLRHAEKAPERPALEVAAERLSYGELALRAARIGTAIAAAEAADGSALTAVYGSP